MAKLTNTEDEILWRDVRNAVDQVSTQMGRQVEFERGTNKVTVVKASDSIMIVIEEVVPVQPTLVAP